MHTLTDDGEDDAGERAGGAEHAHQIPLRPLAQHLGELDFWGVFWGVFCVIFLCDFWGLGGFEAHTARVHTPNNV